MEIHLCFQTPASTGRGEFPCIGDPQRSEVIAAAATGSLTANDGEEALIVNVAAASLFVAHGCAPSASATASTRATTARYTVPPNQVMQVRVRTGDKFAVAAIS